MKQRARRGMNCIWLAWAALASGQVEAQQSSRSLPEDAHQLVQRVVEHMGGPAVSGMKRVRLDMMTQWQRTGYREVPWTDRPSFEPHVDVRDYSIPAWRNTRDLGPTTRIINIVRDSVATTDFGQGAQPLSVAYVDERNELFLYTPDRLVLRLLDARDLRNSGDTIIGGETHRQVSATLDTPRGPLPVVVAFHGGSGLPALLRFRQSHPNDFGLVPYGDMRVEVWYSNWRTFGDISIPSQWDVQRAGAPYKRMTVRALSVNPEFAADSFVVATELRDAYVASRRPMHDLPVDSITRPAAGLLQVHGFGMPAGALQVGDDWLLLEAGYAPLSLERTRTALAASGAGNVAAAILAAARTGNGAVVALVREGIPIFTSRAAEPFIRVMLESAGLKAAGVVVVSEARWLEREGTRLRLEPVDLPDVPGSLLVYSPEMRWVYAADAITPLDLRMVLAHAQALGWRVQAVGTPRGLWLPQRS